LKGFFFSVPAETDKTKVNDDGAQGCIPTVKHGLPFEKGEKADKKRTIFD
jgi:hypothetical protein